MPTTLNLNMSKKINLYSYMVSLGLVFFVIHNPYQPLIQYAFLPWVGMLLICYGVMGIVFSSKNVLSLIKDKISISVLIISVCIALSGVWAWLDKRQSAEFAFAALAIGTLLYSLYLSGRIVGKDLFKPKVFLPAVIIESLSIPIWGAFHNFAPNGGLVSPTNYDIATGFIVFGILVSPKKHWIWLSSLGMACLLFSGSGEAIFIGFVAFVTALAAKVDKDKVFAPVSAVCVVVIMMVFTGVLTRAQAPNVARLDVLMGKPVEASVWTNSLETVNASKLDVVTGFRVTNSVLTLPIKPFGYGINLTNFYWGIPHNIVLIIIEQAGVIALLAWLAVAYFLIKQKSSRYIWIVFISMGCLDHFLFTQALPWWFALSGVLSYAGVLNKGGQENAL